MRTNSGFTLLEVVMVLAIIAITAAVAIPNLLGWIPNHRLKSAAGELRSNLQYARLGAVKQGSSWCVLFDTANNQYSIYSANGDGDWTTTNDNTLVKPVNFNNSGSGVGYGHGNATSSKGSTFGNEVTFPNDLVIFNSRGLLNTYGYVYLNNNQNTAYAVGGKTSGAISLYKWTGSEWK